jgi:CRP-like cAMP-binding protein
MAYQPSETTGPPPEAQAPRKGSAEVAARAKQPVRSRAIREGERLAIHLIRKLEQFTRLSADDKRMLQAASSRKVRELGAREDIIHEGDQPKHVNLVLQGFACRYKVLEDGRRQILAFFVPGDLCDLRMFILKEMDHSIGTLSPVRLAEIPQDTLLELIDGSPRIARALWWNSLVEEAIAREWIVNVGKRNALERMAHIFCEIYTRLRGVGLGDEGSCELPVTQSELADALGLSHVHTNRTLQELRGGGLVSLKGKSLVIHDLAGLQQLAFFNPNYLHLDHDGAEYDANDV